MPDVTMCEFKDECKNFHSQCYAQNTIKNCKIRQQKLKDHIRVGKVFNKMHHHIKNQEADE